MGKEPDKWSMPPNEFETLKNLRIGDIVTLRIGGPLMVVTSFGVAGIFGEGTANCWFYDNNGVPQTKTFSLAALKKATKPVIWGQRVKGWLSGLIPFVSKIKIPS